MRKETREIMRAFLDGRPCTKARTRTDGRAVYLHGNLIAWRADGYVRMTPAGWPSRTTFERLNGLAELMGTRRPYSTRKGVPFFLDTECSPRDVHNYAATLDGWRLAD